MEVRGAYQKAAADRGAAVDDAVEAVEAFLDHHPNDAVALMYKGSLLTMMADDSWLPWNKLRYLNQGLDMMDDALARAARAAGHGRDAELEMLLVRALTNARIPALFGRGDLARQDFERIIGHRFFQRLPAENQAAALAWASVYARQEGEQEKARELARRARALDAGAAESILNGG